VVSDLGNSCDVYDFPADYQGERILGAPRQACVMLSPPEPAPMPVDALLPADQPYDLGM
jgi:hypothetical protein